MQAQPSHSQQQSQISITFGGLPQQKCPFILNFSAQYNSPKIQNKRFNAGEHLNTQISTNSVLIEIQSKEDGEELAKKLEQIKKKSPSMIQLSQQKQLDIKIFGKDKKAYLLLKSDQFDKKLESLNSKIKNETHAEAQERWVELKIFSSNSLQKINKILSERGSICAFLDSLAVVLKFNNSPTIREIIRKILLNNMGEQVSKAAVDSFQYVNLDLQFESSSVLQNYPEVFAGLKSLQINDDFKQVKPLLGNKLDIYLFGKPLSFIANVEAENLYLVLDILFA